MAKIQLVDTSLRDGNQSLWGATGLNCGQILQIAPTMDQVGYSAIDFISSTHMAVSVRYHKENPWEKIRRVKQLMPNTPLSFLTTGMRFISWEKASEELMRFSFRLLVEAGIERFMAMDPMNNVEAIHNMASIIRAEGASDVVAALVYTDSPVHDDCYYANLAAELAKSSDISTLYLKDPGGLLTPARTKTIIPAIKAQIGNLPLELHSHCTIGLAPFSYLEAAELGVSALHVAATPLANGTSQPDAYQTVLNLRAQGHEIAIDIDALQAVNQYFSTLAAAEGLKPGTPQNYDTAFFKHQVPGGMVTTMMRQLEEIGMAHRLPEVFEEIAIVRKELGYPIMVTPFSQVVSTQAVMNVVGGGERYSTIPDEVLRYALGLFGSPPVAIDPNVMDKIHALPRAKELCDEPVMADLKTLRSKFPARLSDEEFLLRAVMPQEQIDVMGRCSRGYNPQQSAIKTLLKELSDRPGITQVAIDKPDFKLQLKRNP